MNQRSLGWTELQVSEICLGTMHFGWRNNESTSFEILDAFRESGGNFYQAVDFCPDPANARTWAALPLDIVGRWLRARRVPRDQWVLATRLILQPMAGADTLKAEAVRRSCESVLRRLQTDHLDLVVLDWNNFSRITDDVLSLLTTLVRAGTMRYFGTANFPVWRVMEAICHPLRHDVCRPETFQADYSLLSRSPFEQEELAISADYHLGFLASAPLAGGYLSGRTAPATGPEAERFQRLHFRYNNPRGRTVLAEVAAVAGERGVPMAQVAHAWVLANPVVTASIIGVNTISYLHDAVAATQLRLTREEVRRLAVAAQTAEGAPSPESGSPSGTGRQPQMNRAGESAYV